MCLCLFFMIIFESTGVKYSVFLGGREVVGGTHPFALNKAHFHEDPSELLKDSGRLGWLSVQ